MTQFPGPLDEIKSRILQTLSQIQDPDLNKDIVTLGFVKDLIIKQKPLGGFDISLTLELTTPACPVKDFFQSEAERLILSIPQIANVKVNMTSRVRDQSALNAKKLPGVRNVIAVGAGKGGVGKSTVSVNLALSLKALGSRVGILDADVHGPSLGQMLSLKGMPFVKDGKMIPKVSHGIPAMTFAFFAPVGDAVIWRGGMTGKAVEQMLFDVDWTKTSPDSPSEDLDYLIVDVPPGTGDIPITLIHSVGLVGAVVVTTPQRIATLDSEKAIALYQKMKVPVLGIVENMSSFECPHCHKHTPLFDSSQTTDQISSEKGVPILARIPLDSHFPVSGDAGIPAVLDNNKNYLSKIYLELAQKIAQQVSIAQYKSATEGSPTTNG